MSTDKTIVLVTGGNNGIGFNTCSVIAAAGSKYHVILASRSSEKGQAALADLQARKLPGTLSPIQLDVTDAKSISGAVETITKDFGRLDILVNNAGISTSSGALIDQLRTTFETNAFGTAVLTDALVPLLKKSKDPRIIYVTSSLGSIAGRTVVPYDKIDMLAYRMSKAALNMLAVSHLTLYKDWGCKVWPYCPGYVATSLGGQTKEEMKKLGAGDPIDSAKGILAIVEGKRDAEVGKFVHRDGAYPW